MKKIFFCLFVLLLTLAFSAKLSGLPPVVDIKNIDLRENRTEFSSTGASVDDFLTSLQTKILYHFEKSFEHFSLIFSSAQDEAFKKAEETLSGKGKETMDFIKEQTQKAVGETIEKEWKKYTSTPAVREKQKTENKKVREPSASSSGNIKEKKKNPSVAEINEPLVLPELPEVP